MKMPTMLFMTIGIAFVVWGASLTVRQIDFDIHAKETVATLVSVGSGRIGSRNTAAKAIATYTVNDKVYKERLAFPAFANTLGLKADETVHIMYDERSPEDARIILQSWDIYLYYIAGIFFMLFGLVLAMFGLMTEKNARKE